MCLAIPGKVFEINKDEVIVDYGFEKRRVHKLIDVDIGDYVIVKEKFVVQKIDRKQAEDFLNLVKNAGE